MHDRGKSDRSVVPAKLPNKPAQAGAEAVEGRGLPEGNTAREPRSGPSAGLGVSSDLDRVRQVARKDRDVRFTALLHHVSVDRLREAYRAISPNAAPGVDGVTWRDYGLDLEANLQDLYARVQRGAYRARPSRRVFIPKPDGRLRPLGVAALEDKILQRAVVEVLNAVYEEDFLGFSYGFRPGRGQHDALDALAVAIDRRRVNWVLDADIRDFFSRLDQGWLERFLEHRIADRRVLRLIQKWLRAGVIEDGEWSKTEEGTAQGASVSPLLANVYLHYVFDLWAEQWRRRHAHGDMIIVRFADDCVPRTLKEDRCRRSMHRMRCCTRDGGWPSAVALQGEVANHREVRRSRAGVLSVAEKGAPRACQVWITKASGSEPPMKCRKRIGDIQNRGRVIAPGAAWREPADWPGGCPAWMVARAWSGLLCGTREPVAPFGRPTSGAVLACGWSSEARTPSSRSVRGRVVMRGTGADLTVVAGKAP
jgi:retron-type reverse transcriptase